MLCDVVDDCFWEVQRIRKYFFNELNRDFLDYTIDNMQDNNKLLKELYDVRGDYVDIELASKVSLYYNIEKKLVADIRYYLIKEYNLTYNDELEKRKKEK